MKEKNHGRSRNPFVEHRSQLHLSLSLLLYLVVYTVVLLVIILTPSVIKFTSSSLSLERQLEASREFLFIDKRVVPAVLAVVTAIAVHFLILTHRIFGPLKRLGGVLRAMEAGDWPPRLERRRRDFHESLFVSFNTALERVGRDLKAAKDLVASTRVRLSAAGGGGKELEEAEEECRRAVEILSRYFPDREEEPRA